MNQPARTFTLIGLVVVILLALHLLPTITVAGTELRAVNILSDILPEVYRQQYAIDVIPRPVPPKPRQAMSDTTSQASALLRNTGLRASPLSTTTAKGSPAVWIISTGCLPTATP